MPDPSASLPRVPGYIPIYRISADADGELWHARHRDTGAMVGLAVLSCEEPENTTVVPRYEGILRTLVKNDNISLVVVNHSPDTLAVRQPTSPAPEPFPWRELCIITAIALLLLGLIIAITLPPYLRVKKRGQAAKVLNGARLYEAAILGWANDAHKAPGTPVTFIDVSDRIPASVELVRSSGHDVLGNAYDISTVGAGVYVNQLSYQALSDVMKPDFWGSYVKIAEPALKPPAK